MHCIRSVNLQHTRFSKFLFSPCQFFDQTPPHIILQLQKFHLHFYLLLEPVKTRNAMLRVGAKLFLHLETRLYTAPFGRRITKPVTFFSAMIGFESTHLLYLLYSVYWNITIHAYMYKQIYATNNLLKYMKMCLKKT